MTGPQSSAELDAALQALVGRQGPVQVAAHPVAGDEIRAWCGVMGEANARFLAGDAAPPATLNMWTMPDRLEGSGAGRDDAQPQHAAYGLLDAAGFTGVVATNSDQAYERLILAGDVLSAQTTLAGISAEKQTALGTGHFVTTEVAYTDGSGAPVGRLTFRIFKFRPGTGRGREEAPQDPGVDDEPPRRPRPRWNQDQAWHWEGLRERELRIQRFTDSGRLVHPPANADPVTHGMDHDWVVASGRGTLYSWTAPEHPQVPGFDYPLVVGLVELEEGVRLVSNVVGLPSDQLEIGMPLELCWLDSHDDVTLHQFRPAQPGRRDGTLRRGEVAVGDRLPPCPVDVTRKLVVGGATATFDGQDVHHDPAAARAKGLPDVIMNILTSSGVVARWLGDWAGDDAEFRNLRIGLGVSNHPDDVMTLTGTVEACEGDTVTVAFAGTNSLGRHVHGAADLVLPDDGRGG